MQISNKTLSVTPQRQVTPETKMVNENLFVQRGDLPDSAQINKGEATVFFSPITPDEAWQQYAFSTSGSMIETASAIPAGYQDVSSQIEDMLKEHYLQAPEGMTIKFGIKELKDGEIETEESKTPVFIVENISDHGLTEEIEKALNNTENDHFKKSYLALDKLTMAENIHLALQRDNVTGRFIKASANENGDQDFDSFVTYGYKQDFSMGFNGNKWMMNAVVRQVELMRLEKIAS